MYIEVLDSTASLNTYDIKLRGVTPAGRSGEVTFKATVLDGLPPTSGYSACPLSCADSMDTITITASPEFP